jgi:drug/metabolite transporter (DMT)-like permease
MERRYGSGSSSRMEDLAGVRHHLLRLGLDLPGHSRGVREVPPLVLASMRFFVAGAVLFGWMRLKGTPSPSRREWLAASLLAVCIFVLDYGLLFWAEQRVPSGIAAVMLATIPVFMALSEIIILRTQRLTFRLALALLVGIGGVAVLVSRSLSQGLGEAPIDRAGAVALVIAAISWSIASALTRKLPLPASKVMSSGAQMLAGGILLALTAASSASSADFTFKPSLAAPGTRSPT